ncbi:MAG: hypothetical protein WC856_02310 [Methylococcaceae bacterium]
MNKILIVSLLMASACANAESLQKPACLQFLEAGVYNGVLEDTCGFTGGVKDKLKQVYTNGGCSNIVPPEEIDVSVKNVLDDIKARYQSLGGKAFCEANKKPYYDLAGN